MFVWNKESIKALLLIARQYQLSELSLRKKKSFFFVVLERGLRQLGFELDRKEIRRKWKGLKERYYFIKHNPTLFEGRAKWEYMTVMEQLLTGVGVSMGQQILPGTQLKEQVAGEEPPTMSTSEKNQLPAGNQTTGQDGTGKSKNKQTENQQKSVFIHSCSDDSSGSDSGGNADSDDDATAFTQHMQDILKENNEDAEILTSGIGKLKDASLPMAQLPTVEHPEKSLKSNGRSVSPTEKSDASELNLIGAQNVEIVNDEEGHLSFADDGEPVRKRRRKKKAETNTDRIIAAMEDEGDRDRAILRQFMKEFSSAAAALTSAIQQMSETS